MTTTRRYGGQSAEERQAARRDKLIGAGRELLVSDGIAKTTVTAVCARAGLTERYFYESFTNRDALLDAVFTEVATEGAVKIFGAAVAGADEPRAQLRIAFATAIDLLTEDLGLRRALADTETEPTLMRHRAALTRVVADLSGQYAHVIFGEQPYDDARARAAVLFVIGGCAEVFVSWLTGRQDISREELIETCSDLMLSSVNAMLETVGRRVGPVHE